MLGQGIDALCPEDFENCESGSLGLNGAVFPFVCGALRYAEERASEILCPWDNRSPPNGCIQ